MLSPDNWTFYEEFALMEGEDTADLFTVLESLFINCLHAKGKYIISEYNVPYLVLDTCFSERNSDPISSEFICSN